MSNIERRKRLRAGDTDRDAVLEVLHAAFAAGRLTPTDLADRQEAALAARYIDELPELVEDCPEGAQLVRGWGGAPVPAPQPWSSSAPVPTAGDGNWTVTIMSGLNDIRGYGINALYKIELGLTSFLASAFLGSYKPASLMALAHYHCATHRAQCGRKTDLAKINEDGSFGMQNSSFFFTCYNTLTDISI